MDPEKRLTELVKSAKPQTSVSTMSMDRCVQVLTEIHQLGTNYAENEERAFILCLRFISIVVEELPRHPNYCLLSVPERSALDAKALQTMIIAEELKRRIRQKYEREQQQEEKHESSSVIGQMVASTSSSNQPQSQLNIEEILEHQRHLITPYVQCQCMSDQSILFQHLIIPNNIAALFQLLISTTPTTAEHQQKALEPPFHFGILYGEIDVQLNRNVVIVTQLMPCRADAFQKKHVNWFSIDPGTGKQLIFVGCICSSLEMASKLGVFRHCKITEIVCIVSLPGPANTRVLHLLDMSPNGGSDFHKTVPSSATTATARLGMMPICAHLYFTTSRDATMITMQQQQQLKAVQLEKAAAAPANGGQRQAATTRGDNCDDDGTGPSAAKVPKIASPPSSQKPPPTTTTTTTAELTKTAI